jgi:hypothetical protein
VWRRERKRIGKGLVVRKERRQGKGYGKEKRFEKR